MIDSSVINKDAPSFEHDIIISIQSVHAKRIYEGKKHYELRKVVPSKTPRRIFLYETNGTSKISGHIVVERILTTSPEILWKLTGSSATSKNRFFDYFRGRGLAHAIEIASVVKYKTPIKLSDITKIEPGFRPSQNFLYLEKLPKLQKALFERAFDECVDATKANKIHLRKFDESRSAEFIDAVDDHITDSYLETGPKYAKKILEQNREGEDHEGVFTKRKSLLEIWHKRSFVGFVVLTEKMGGSVKTGPTIIVEQFRNRGLGKELRQTLHSLLSQLGYHKVYCTAPANNYSAMNYLVASSYRIEAHLSNHYHDAHDELVFGHLLSKFRGMPDDSIKPIEPITSVEKLTVNSPEVADFIFEEFSTAYCSVSLQWVARQIKEAIAFAKGRRQSFKPRVIYTGEGLSLLAVCLCVPKRGGGAKLILLSKTAHQKSLSIFIDYVAKSLMAHKSLGIRKLYCHVPIQESDLIQSFHSCGFGIEGVLERPYNHFSDMLVLARSFSN